MSDTPITLNDPDDPLGPPTYEGPASHAGIFIEPGTYEVTDEQGRKVTLVIHPDGESTVTR